MKTDFIESVESFKVSFGGKNSIDAETFTKSINNTIDLVKESANALDPSCFLRLEIKATQEGSFETVIDAVIRHKDDLLLVSSIAGNIIQGFLNFLLIKEHLKGRKAKKIESNDKETAIQNQDNQIIKVQKEIGNAYFQNNKIDNLIVNQFTILTDRSNYSITTKDNKVIIDKKAYEDMKQPVVDENPTAKTIKQKPIEVELLLKKPDLLGDSKWQFVYNKTIEAKIEDEDFLEKVRRGKISVRAGVKIPCLMEVEYDLSDRLDIIQKSEKYNIKKITGDIIEPEEDNQQSLFE
ncbi:MAG: hypothetical protein EBT63_05545 [Proteobacteria bacterium]|nr:hypothetical protein [Pseudomonadota bacterium]NCA28594.1 hypothetical protein [Pseudomonadota bacterium]